MTGEIIKDIFGHHVVSYTPIRVLFQCNVNLFQPLNNILFQNIIERVLKDSGYYDIGNKPKSLYTDVMHR